MLASLLAQVWLPPHPAPPLLQCPPLTAASPEPARQGPLSMSRPGKPVSGSQLFSRHRDARGWAAGPGRAQLAKRGRGRPAGRSAGCTQHSHMPAGTRQGLSHSFPVSLLTRGIDGQHPEQAQPQNASSGFAFRAKSCTLERRGETPVKFLEELALLG